MIVKTFHDIARKKQEAEQSQPVKTFHDKVSTTVPTAASVTPSPIKTFGGVESKSKPIAPPTPTASAKPLFKPAVKLTLDADETQIINECLTSLGFTDFHMTDSEKSRILFLKDEIKIDDHVYIGEYGSNINSDESLEKLTKISQSPASAQLHEVLRLIMENMSKIDMENFTEERSQLMRFFGKKTIRKEDFPEFVKEMKANVAKCQSHLNTLQKTVPLFESVDDETEKQFRMLSVIIVAGQLRINKEKAKIAEDETKQGDFFAAQRLQDIKAAVERFGRRVHNLMLIRQTMLMRMGQLRLEQKNVLALIDQTQDIVQLVIPTWLQHMLTLSSAKGTQSTEFYEALAKSQQALHDKLTNVTGEKTNDV